MTLNPNELAGFRRSFVDVQTGAASENLNDLIKDMRHIQLDVDAINVFLRSGLFLRNSTAFSKIRTSDFAIPPLSEKTMSTKDIVDCYIELFRVAIRRCLISHEGQPFAMGLSGGRDSRHILLETCRQGVPPALAWTVGKDSDDAVIAKKISNSVGVPHLSLDYNDTFSNELKKNRLTNYCSWQHAWMCSVDNTFMRRFSCFYDGLGGDILSQSSVVTRKMIKLFSENRLDELAESFIRTESIPLIKDSWQPLFPPETALELVRAELERHQRAVNPSVSFLFANRTRRDIAELTYGIVGSNKATIFVPYLDTDLVEFFLSLPAECTFDKQLHTRALKQAFPEISVIPFALKSPRITPDSGKITSALLFLFLNYSPFLDHKKVYLHLVRSLFHPNSRAHLPWVISRLVYLTQIVNPLRFLK